MKPPPERRRGNPRGGVRSRWQMGTSDPGYTDEELEWLRALQRAKLTGGPRPSWAAVLALARALGYRRVAAPTAAYAWTARAAAG